MMMMMMMMIRQHKNDINSETDRQTDRVSQASRKLGLVCLWNWIKKQSLKRVARKMLWWGTAGWLRGRNVYTTTTDQRQCVCVRERVCPSWLQCRSSGRYVV